MAITLNENIVLVSIGDSAEIEDTIINLFEKYAYEFSQYDKEDMNEHGLYENNGTKSDFRSYLRSGGRITYLIKYDGKIAGFILIDSNDRPTKIIADLFIVHKYRRCGVGSKVAKAILETNPGSWRVRCYSTNSISVKFWKALLHSLPEYRTARDAVYANGTKATSFYFQIP